MNHWTKQFECGDVAYQKDDGILICGNALKALKKIPKESIDLIVLDAPWQYTCTSVPRTWVGLQYETMSDYNVLRAVLLAEKCLKEDRHLHLWITSPRLIEQARIAMAITAFTKLRYVSSYVWHKQSGLGMGHYFRIDCEYSLLFVKGKRQAIKRDVPNWVSADLSGHSHKPTAAIEAMLKISTTPGEIVLDPFIHEGQTAVVAKSMGRKFVGIEINPTLIRGAEENLSQELLFTRGKQ